MTEVFINKDAEYLANLAQVFSSDDAEVSARLLQIARNLQGLDEANTTAYANGWRDGNASHLARSNVVQTSRPISPNLAQAIAAYKGEVTRLPTNVPKVEMDNTLSIADLDLE